MPTVGAVTAALATAAGGNLALLAAAVTEPAAAGGSLAPWVTGGGSAAAVAGLVYVARMVVKGDLVPRAVEEREREQSAAIRGAADRETRLLELTQDAMAREQVLSNLGGESVRALTLAVELERSLSAQMTRKEELYRDVLAELRWWKDQRNRPGGRG